MSGFTFQMLLKCHYQGDKNDVDELHVEHLVDDNWQELDLNIKSPGFDIFMYAIITCQHMYFKNNAAEYGLVLDSSEGLITVIADEHRSIETLHADFNGKLKNGTSNAEIEKSIAARMELCPVSINLKDIPDRMVTIKFD